MSNNPYDPSTSRPAYENDAVPPATQPTVGPQSAKNAPVEGSSHSPYYGHQGGSQAYGYGSQQPPQYPPAGNYPQQYPSPYGEQPHMASPYQQPAPYQNPDGARHAKTSLICGIVGIFIFGLILGPIAIWQASKAEALGVAAGPGKITGWIAFGLSAAWFVLSLLNGFSGSFSIG